jgi:septum formation protein
MHTPLPDLVLASSSRYRRELLGRLTGHFRWLAPDVDESPRPGETPAALAARLALLKATAIALVQPTAVVIGSDQVAALGERVLGKPGTAARAVTQLAGCSGQTVVFHTAVAVLAPGASGPRSHVDRTEVEFRTLSEEEIQRYVDLDQPLDCAGSFRAESLGISLFNAVRTGDPSAIQGLPLIWVSAALRELGWQLP